MQVRPETRTIPTRALKFVLGLYLLQLFVPALVLLDVYGAWMDGWFGVAEKAAATLAVIWLIAGIAGLFSLRNTAFVQRVSLPLLSLYTLILGLVGCELLLRTVQPNYGPVLYRPGMRLELRPDPNIVPGASGQLQHFTISRDGLRGPEMPTDASTYKIVTVGGSSTASLYNDDAKEWPHLLMTKLNARPGGPRVWVGNAGVSGHTAVEHLSLLEGLPQLAHVNLLLFTIGFNDFNTTVGANGASTQPLLEENARFFATSIHAAGVRQRHPYYRRLLLFDTLHRIALTALRRGSQRMFVQTPSGRELIAMRAQRATGHVVPLPDLSTGIAEYRQRVRHLSRQCGKMNVRCLFVTQPSMWKQDMPLQQQRLLLLGAVYQGRETVGFVPAANLARGLAAYNEALLQVCREERLECFDLASIVPSETSIFYDDVHFNDAGANFVAGILADYLSGKPPFLRDH